jgi:hypothetical protein
MGKRTLRDDPASSNSLTQCSLAGGRIDALIHAIGRLADARATSATKQRARCSVGVLLTTISFAELRNPTRKQIDPQDFRISCCGRGRRHLRHGCLVGVVDKR